MNISYKLLRAGLFTGLLFHFDISSAQDKVSIPAPPYVSAVPDFFQWTISLEKSTKDAVSSDVPLQHPAPKTIPHSPEIRQVTCTKTKYIQRDTLVYDDGRSSEVWYYKNYIVVRSANGQFLINPLSDLAGKVVVPEMCESGFAGVAWITAKDFRGKEKLPSGLEVYRYSEVSKICGDAGAAQQVPVEAMIAVDSGFPVVIAKDGRTFTYSYQPPPLRMLQLPADFQAELSSIEEKSDFVQKLRNSATH